MSNYIITSNGKATGYYLARRYIDKYRCVDFIAPLYCEYVGRLTASQALIFDSTAKAQNYLNAHKGLIPDTWQVVPYNVCCNCIEK